MEQRSGRYRSDASLAEIFICFELFTNLLVFVVMVCLVNYEYETVRECQKSIVHVSLFSLWYVVFLVVRSLVLLCVMACTDKFTRLHYHARKVYTCVDLVVSLTIIVFSKFNNTTKGMEKKCLKYYKLSKPTYMWVTVNFWVAQVYCTFLLAFAVVSCITLLFMATRTVSETRGDVEQIITPEPDMLTYVEAIHRARE